LITQIDWALLALQLTESPWALRVFLGFMCDMNAKWSHISCSLDRVVTSLNISPKMRSLGWLVAYLQSFEYDWVCSTSTSWTSPFVLSFGLSFSSCTYEFFMIIFSKSSPKESISTTFFARELDFSNFTCIDSSIVKMTL